MFYNVHMRQEYYVKIKKFDKTYFKKKKIKKNKMISDVCLSDYEICFHFYYILNGAVGKISSLLVLRIKTHHTTMLRRKGMTIKNSWILHIYLWIVSEYFPIQMFEGISKTTDYIDNI